MNSKLILSQTDGRPMYLQIMEQIKHRVAIGDWQPGMSLPSIRKLAVDLRISVITVNRAYTELEREGIIITQQGKGSQIASNKKLPQTLKRRQLEEQLDTTTKLALAMDIDLTELQNAIKAHYEKNNKLR